MPATHDLSHAEAAEAFRAFAAEIGPKAEVYVALNVHFDSFSEKLHVSIYPKGICKSCAAYVYSDTYTEALAAARSKWAEVGDESAAETIRSMALKIISITADEGVCSELSLVRAFSAAEVKSYGERACEEATRISGNRPFTIVRAASDVEAA